MEHIDFYGVDRATQLPLINVSVPTPLFFYGAPLLVTAIYSYFHLYLIRLWDALGNAPVRVDGTKLGDAISPWLVSDAALHLRARIRQDNCTAPRALESASMALNILLAWVFGPFVIGWLWWASMPARDFKMTTIAGICLLAALIAGSASLAMMVHRMRVQSTLTAQGLWSSTPALGLMVGTIPLVLALGLQRTAGKPEFLAPLVLIGEELVEKPANWLPDAIARKDFRAIWCKREGIHPCKDLGEHQDAFDDEWKIRRAAAFASLNKPTWSSPGATRPDFRQARLPLAFLAGANLSGAKMQDAILIQAEMQGADLSRAEMQGAILFKAEMQGADLSGAEMQGVRFDMSQLTGSPDRRNFLKETNLSASINNGGVLRFVDLTQAIFDPQTDWRNTFFDSTVTVPPKWRNQVGQPCLWDWNRTTDSLLSDKEFYGRWRGWLSLRPEWDDGLGWKFTAPSEWAEVPRIDPPAGCQWYTDALIDPTAEEASSLPVSD